jgi:hypothetical protein
MSIISKLDPGVDPTNGWGPRSTCKNFKQIFKVLISNIEKLRNNSCWCKLYIVIPHDKVKKTFYMDVDNIYSYP